MLREIVDEQVLTPVIRAYDPMKLFARMARFYRFSDKGMRKMHYVKFFAYAREMDAMIREENRRQSQQTAAQQNGFDGQTIEMSGEQLKAFLQGAEGGV